MERHYARWNCDQWYWQEHAYTIIPQFAEVRQDLVREDVLEWYDLPNMAELRFAAFPEGAGTIHLNSLQPELPFTGTYFNGNAIDLSAFAEEGFIFDHWEYAEEQFTSTSEVIQRSFAMNGTITAFFRDADATLHAYPNPFVDATKISVTGVADGWVNISVYDVQGRVVHTTGQAVGDGVNAVVLPLSALSSGIYLVRAEVAGTILHTSILKLERE
ncbi:MAG TPA: T9SS type A sorting domain-containing protein [Flavobacteriales bacterium]|nr:T9SS type A sorting domain-containing protein [Flavobacteriales bacterium]